MQAQISHRHEGWDDAADDYTERRLHKLERSLQARDLAPTPMHLSVREEGHGLTECSARLILRGTVLSARAASHSMFVALCSVFDELERQSDRQHRRATRVLRATARRELATSGRSPVAARRQRPSHDEGTALFDDLPLAGCVEPSLG